MSIILKDGLTGNREASAAPSETGFLGDWWKYWRGSANLVTYLLTVIVPASIYIIYVCFIRSSGYISEAAVFLEKDPILSTPSLDFGILASSGSDQIDSLVILEYIRSKSLLDELEDEYKLRDHYSSEQWDYFSRLPDDASEEAFFDFVSKRVTARLESDSLVIKLRVESYDRDYSKKLAEGIVERADRFVNEIGQTLAREQMRFVEQELSRAARRVQDAGAALIQLQKENELLSPEIESQSLSQIIATLQGQLAAKRAELSALRSYLNESAQEVSSVRATIRALEKQIEEERSRQVGLDRQGLGELFLDYEAAQTALKVATDTYQVALRTLETARLDASRKAKHLIQVSAPTRPDEALVPKRLHASITAVILLHLLFFVLILIIATVRDHRD